MNQTASVWDSLIDDKDKASELKIRSEMLIEIQEYVRTNFETNRQAASFFGISYPRMSDLVNGRLHQFGFSSLLSMTNKFSPKRLVDQITVEELRVKLNTAIDLLGTVDCETGYGESGRHAVLPAIKHLQDALAELSNIKG